MQSKILIVEDDSLFAETIADFLSCNGFEPHICGSAKEAYSHIYENAYDAYIFDIKLPDEDGLRLLETLRGFGDAKPALFLTSLTTTEAVVKGFELGCDDFIKKPCDLDELLARLKAAIKKSVGQAAKLTDIGRGYSFDIISKTVFLNGIEYPLAPKVAVTLSLLVANIGRTVPFGVFEERLGSYDREFNFGSLRVYVNNIKKLLGDDAIVNFRGIGYRLEKR